MAIYKLEEIGSFKSGFSNLKIQKYGSGINFVNYLDVFRNPVITRNVALTKYQANDKEIRNFNLNYGDALFTASSETSKEIAMSSVYLRSDLSIFTGFAKKYSYNQKILSPLYASYLFRSKSFRQNVTTLSTGYTRYNISQKNLGKIEVFIPEISQQQKIIDIIEPIEKMKMKIDELFHYMERLIKNFPSLNEKFTLKESCNFIKYKNKNLNQISAKILNKRRPILNCYEKPETYKTNTFFAPKGSLLINTIRPNLEKFCLNFDDCDFAGSLAAFEMRTNQTAIIQNLLNDAFWNQAKKLTKGTKMPIISKKDLVNIKLKKINYEIKEIVKYFNSLNQILIELDQLQILLIKLLIK